MNGAMIVYILGQVLRIEGLLMLPSFFVGLIYGEQQGWAYLVMGAVCLVVGTLIALKKPKNNPPFLLFSAFFEKNGEKVTFFSSA